MSHPPSKRCTRASKQKRKPETKFPYGIPSSRLQPGEPVVGPRPLAPSPPEQKDFPADDVTPELERIMLLALIDYEERSAKESQSKLKDKPA